MNDTEVIVAPVQTGGADHDVPDQAVQTGASEVMSDDVPDSSEDESSDEVPKDTPAVDDRPPAVLRLERAQRLKREGEIARAEHDAAAIATDQKTARLKALRLEREAADRIVAAKEAAAKAELKPAAKRKRVVKAPA